LFNELVSLSARTIANFTKIFIYANQILIFHFHLLRPAILCLFCAGILKLRAIPGTKRNKYRLIPNNRTPASPTILLFIFSSNVMNKIIWPENKNSKQVLICIPSENLSSSLQRNDFFIGKFNLVVHVLCQKILPNLKLSATT